MVVLSYTNGSSANFTYTIPIIEAVNGQRYYTGYGYGNSTQFAYVTCGDGTISLSRFDVDNNTVTSSATIKLYYKS